MAAIVGVLVLVPALAHAGGRKRVVILELEGPKAEKFHDDLVKLVKKSHTVIPVEKWNEKAEELDASKASDKNFKKVAKKLKVDAIITGKIDKRRDEYIIKLKLREGKSGELVGEGVDTKSEEAKLDGQATKDIKNELIEQIAGLKANRSGFATSDDDEEEEDKPAKKPVKKPSKDDEEEDEEEDVKPVKKGFSRKDDEEEEEEKPAKKPVKKPVVKDDEEEEEEDKPVKKGFSRKDDEEVAALKTKKDDEEEDDPLPKAPKKKPAAKDDEDEDEEDAPSKKVASKDDEDEDEDEDGGSVEESSGEDEAPVASALSPGERAVDAVIGLSLNARRMSFTYDADLTNKPPPYKGVPVAGLLIDATVFPGAIGHKRKGMAKNFGVTVMFDKVLKVSSEAMGVKLPTSQARYALGAVFRYPLGKATVGATLRFGRQNFTISPSGGITPDIPNVNYTIIDPSLYLKYQATPKVTLNVNLGFMLLTNTGQIQKGDQYGPATVTGFEGELGGDYMLTKNLFARAAFKFETIGFKFQSGAMKTNMRDADGAQDVYGARDSYIGGAVTVGYLY